MQYGPHPSASLGALRRVPAAAVLLVAAGAVMAACGASSSPPSASIRADVSASCAGVSGAHHAGLVVEASAGKVVRRCIGFSGTKISALALLADSRIETGTQKYSFGVALCQVDDVPAHYSQCLASGQDYWAVFLSTGGHRWTSPSTGVSDIRVPGGGSLGLRYDPPTGSPAPPPPPSPA